MYWVTSTLSQLHDITIPAKIVCRCSLNKTQAEKQHRKRELRRSTICCFLSLWISRKLWTLCFSLSVFWDCNRNKINLIVCVHVTHQNMQTLCMEGKVERQLTKDDVALWFSILKNLVPSIIQIWIYNFQILKELLEMLVACKMVGGLQEPPMSQNCCDNLKTSMLLIFSIHLSMKNQVKNFRRPIIVFFIRLCHCNRVKSYIRIQFPELLPDLRLGTSLRCNEGFSIHA